MPSPGPLRVALSMLFQTWLFSWIVFLAFYFFLSQHSISSFTIFFSSLFLFFIDAFANFSYVGFSYSPRILDGSEPSVIRLVNPQMSWAFGLIYLIIVTQTLKKWTKKRAILVTFFSALAGWFSLAITAVLSLASGLYFLFKKNPHRFFMGWICCVLGISLLIAHHELAIFAKTPKGLEIGTGGFEKTTVFMGITRIFLSPFSSS